MSFDQGTRNICLTIQYDGTDFCGWQRQDGLRSVQGEVEAAIESMVHHPAKLGACSRTDSGVHAFAMPANFRTPRDIPLIGFLRGLNDKLDDDVAIIDVREVAPEWDARDRAVAKRYSYRYLLGESPKPLLGRRSWWVRRQALDVNAMHEAAQHFLGSHDFGAFRASKCVARTHRRFMHRLEVSASPQGDEVVFSVIGNAFLTHMVRIMAGTLFRVGVGHGAPEEIVDILASMERARAGMTAPARGLTLEEVYFEGYPRIGKASSDAA